MTGIVGRSPDPGWYADPDGGNRWRWWDGGRWTDQYADRSPVTPRNNVPGTVTFAADGSVVARSGSVAAHGGTVVPSTPPPTNSDLVRGMFANADYSKLFSLRFGCAVIMAALVLGTLASMLWRPLGVIVFVAAFIFLTVTGLLFGVPVTCPQCRKRIKVGARVCRWCGAPVT